MICQPANWSPHGSDNSCPSLPWQIHCFFTQTSKAMWNLLVRPQVSDLISQHLHVHFYSLPTLPSSFTQSGSRNVKQRLFPGWAQIHLPRVYPSTAVECVTPCPGAITVPLHTRFPKFITTIRACQLLLMIAQPLPMKESIDWQKE